MTLDDMFTAARTGDPKAREALARALYKILWPRFARSFSDAEAKDLVQTTLVLIFRTIDRDPEWVPLRSFEEFVGVAARWVELKARRAWARERGGRVASLLALLTITTSLSERLVRRERVSQLITAADELDTADQRTLLGWAKGDDWRQQIAIEGVTRSALRSRVRRALARLRDIVAQQADVGRPDLEPATT